MVIIHCTLARYDHNPSAELAVRYLARAAGYKNTNTVASALKSLQERGYITVDQPGRGQVQIITVLLRAPALHNQLPADQVSTCSESLVSTCSESPVYTPRYTNESVFKPYLNHQHHADDDVVLKALMDTGISEGVAKGLLVISQGNGRPADYISGIVGYVAHAPNVLNAAGYIYQMIVTNSDIPVLRSSEKLKDQKRVQSWGKYLNKPVNGLQN